MPRKNQSLKEMLAVDLPPEFVCTLLERAPAVYREAYAAVWYNPDLGKREAQYLLGHQRRALFEATFRESARLHGLPFSMKRTTDERGHAHGCYHVRVIVGRFAFTQCHVQSPGAFPKSSRSREQYSQINEHAAQVLLFPTDSIPREEELYGIIIHTKHRDNKREIQSLAVGFPNSEFTAWIQEPIPLAEIEALQAASIRKVIDLQPAIERARPRWKTENRGRGKQDSED